MPTTYHLKCDDKAITISVSRVDETLLRVILDRVYPQGSPFEPISNLAELMAGADQEILLRRIFLWDDARKPAAVPRQALFSEVTGRWTSSSETLPHSLAPTPCRAVRQLTSTGRRCPSSRRARDQLQASDCMGSRHFGMFFNVASEDVNCRNSRLKLRERPSWSRSSTSEDKSHSRRTIWGPSSSNGGASRRTCLICCDEPHSFSRTRVATRFRSFSTTRAVHRRGMISGSDASNVIVLAMPKAVASSRRRAG